jgi:riboflavin transporter FmnP
MDTKTIAIITIFTALSVILVLSPFKIPAPYAPFLKYQIWEIPIVVAFLLYGPSVGVAISIMNTVLLLVVYPGDLPTGPLYNLVAILSMLLGVYITYRSFTKQVTKRQETILIVSSTILGIITRVIFMSIINWIFLRYPYPIGFSIPEEGLTAMLPIIGVFNATLTLYTIPVGYVIAKSMSSRTKTFSWR